jgi:hypothetical protein
VSGADPRSLLGEWRLKRRVVDRRAALFGTVLGTLSLVDEGPRIRWRERGTLRWDGADLPITRELLLQRDNGEWQVRFADGRPFHRWLPGALVEHQCNADLYRGLVDAAPDRLRVLWDVLGPGKDQRIFTTCSR